MRTVLFSTLFSVVALATTFAGTHAFANDGFNRIPEKSEFVALITGKSLTRLGIRLDVSEAGQITGRAFGYEVGGDWSWQGGYFCRNLSYGGDDLPYNCQMVKVKGDTLRFISDKGTGDMADLRLR